MFSRLVAASPEEVGAGPRVNGRIMRVLEALLKGFDLYAELYSPPTTQYQGFYCNMCSELVV